MKKGKQKCIHEVLKRVGTGDTNIEDAVYLLRCYQCASQRIEALQAQIQLMSMPPAVRQRLMN